MTITTESVVSHNHLKYQYKFYFLKLLYLGIHGGFKYHSFVIEPIHIAC